MALLEVRDLTVRYGEVVAVDGADLDVVDGTIVGLIGPNGAGKTSLIDALTGFTHSEGTIRFADQAVDELPAHERARLGLVRTWQSLELFDDLTMAETVALASTHGRDRLRRAWRHSRPRQSLDVLDRLGLGHVAGCRPASLSQGQRKLAGLARALAAGPQLLLADEPAAGLDTVESKQLGETFLQLAAEGLPILLIDHDMNLMLSVCEHVYVLEFGRIIASGSPDAIRRDPKVIAAYLGEQRSDDGRQCDGEKR